MNKQEILAALQFRHACKEFDTTKKISDEDFNLILEAARLSPSSLGLEPWHFVVLQDKELRNIFRNVSWGASKKLDTASHFVLGLTMKAPLIKWDSDYVKDFMKRVQNLTDEAIVNRIKLFEDFQKSDFDLTDDRKILDWATKQNYIALANMMTVAAFIGIDSCPIEGFKQKECEDVLKNNLQIDTTKYSLSYMVAFGYRKNPQSQKTRRCIDEVVSWK